VRGSPTRGLTRPGDIRQPLVAVSSVFEYTILSAARQMAAKSRMTGGWSSRLSLSQARITSYVRRP
jgi:hypothetical protein